MPARAVALLRGINLGPRRRIAMAQLRENLGQAGYEGVATYLQSGNVVLRSELDGDALARRLEGHIREWFGFDVPVVLRSAAELAEILVANPLRDVADEPKRYQVSFLSGELDDSVVAELSALAVEPERVAILGREVYAWHPDGVIGSRLASALATRKLGVTVTARNWTTVTKLAELSRG
ncbi:MAG: DUF1697 domain-containing protein [Actinomycetota bacterium]|nr:DUF1697 domain-containing protein [Actinomycetota bacterium]